MGLIAIFKSNPELFAIISIALIFSLCFHEFSHAYIAYILGDDTAASQGRLTLNPLVHLDFIGSMMLLFIGFGYAKPVPVNPQNFKNPRTDMMRVALAGPASNLILTLIACFLIRIYKASSNYWFIQDAISSEGLILALYVFAVINMTLAIFNLIPVHPLDGGQIFGGYLYKINPELEYKLRTEGPKYLLFIILFGYITGISLIGMIISPFHEIVAIMSGLK